MACDSEAFAVKGPRVALRRWFSWLPAAAFGDSTWHSRLLVLISLGVQLGLWEDWTKCPLWGGPLAEASAPPQVATQQDPEKLAAGLAKAAKAVGKTDSSTGGKAEETGGGAGLMKTPNDELAALRKQCANS
eukprot:11222653-Lingulodinium_polyedra.AAC.1